MIVTFLFPVLSGSIKEIAPFMVWRTAGMIDRINILFEASFPRIGALLDRGRRSTGSTGDVEENAAPLFKAFSDFQC